MSAHTPNPAWVDGVPLCSEDGCGLFDGKRCGAPGMGCRPSRICEPATKELSAAKDVLLVAARDMSKLMDLLFESVPWGKTRNLPVALLNEAPAAMKRAIAKAEGR